MRRINLREYEPSEPQPLDQSELIALRESRVVDLLPAPSGEETRWIVRGKQFVGVLRMGDLEIRLHPKLPVRRLLFLLGYATDARGWLDVTAEVEVADDLVTAVAYAFALQAERALARGILQGYVTREEALQGLRGRLREAEQLRRHGGLILPLEVVFDDFTVDVDENRLLASAAELLLRLDVPSPVRRRLRRLRSRLADVSRLTPGAALPLPRFDRLNERYRPAVMLARLILQGSSLELGIPTVAGGAFLFDMNKVFEDFITAALQSALERHGGSVEAQHRSDLDEAGRVPIRPDVAWWSGARCLAVVDAKYKRLTSDDIPNPDVYQVFAYCTALRLPLGHLVYPTGESAPTVHVIRNAGTEIHVHAVPLAESPEHLLEIVDQLAIRIAAASRAEGAGRISA